MPFLAPLPQPKEPRYLKKLAKAPFERLWTTWYLLSFSLLSFNKPNHTCTIAIWCMHTYPIRLVSVTLTPSDAWRWNLNSGTWSVNNQFNWLYVVINYRVWNMNVWHLRSYRLLVNDIWMEWTEMLNAILDVRCGLSM